MIRSTAFAAALVLLAGVPCASARQAAPSVARQEVAKGVTLKIGDAAPAMTIEKWVKGDPVTGFEKGRVYVLEFWATWCGPCIASMPHLTDLQRQYKDRGVTIIGVTSKDRRNDLAAVEQLVADRGDAIGYSIAWDTERKTNEAFMRAAQRGGIPCSFVIDGQGRLAYIGHPMTLDAVLPRVLDAAWDSAKHGPELAGLEDEFFELFRAPDQYEPKEALEKIGEFVAKYPQLAGSFSAQRFELLMAVGDYAGAYALGGAVVDELIARKDESGLNELAWNIVDPAGKVTTKDLNLALRAATEADRLSEGKNAPIIDTLARVHWLKGDKARAIELQEKAVALAEGRMRAELEKALAEYRAEEKN